MKKKIVCAAVATLCGMHQGNAATTSALELDAEAVPTVITATRLKQSQLDVPASVTILEGDMLRRFGVVSIPEALRFVPGMEVTQATGNWYQINYHGTSVRAPRRMNVLVDGISIYRPAFSEVFWTQLPVALEDIERIEVTRGSNSATYGPNSMMAVVNIITRNPQDRDSVSASAYYGEGDTYVARAAFSKVFGSTAASLSFSGEGNRGYDWISQHGDGHDSTRTTRVVFRSQTQVRESSTLDLQAAAVQGTNQVPFTSNYETWPDIKLRDYYFGAGWTERISDSNELHARLTHSQHSIDQRWTGCFPAVVYVPQLYTLYRANPDYANAILAGQIPSGGSASDNLLAAQTIGAIQALGPQAMQTLCGDTNQDRDETRTDFELQDTVVVSPELRFVAGLGARHQQAQSQTFLGGKASNTLYRAFGNVEYRPTDTVSLNIGGYAEHDKLVGWTFAPRGAINVHLAPGHSLRAVVSKGLRTPDVQEQQGDISYTVHTQAPAPGGTTTPRFYQSATAPGGLRAEEEVSAEIGYVFVEPKYGIVADTRLFRERLTRLISEVVDVTSFHPTNNNSVTLTGAELQVTFAPAAGWQAFANYTYLDNRDATAIVERTQYSRHSGAIGFSRDLGQGWHGSLAYFGSSGNGVDQNAYGRLDITAGRRFAMDQTRIDILVGVSRLDSPEVTYFIREGRAGVVSRTDDRTRIFGRVSVNF